MGPTRRDLLKSVGITTTAALSGCIQGMVASGGSGPDWSCGDEYPHPASAWFNTVHTDDDVFELTVDPTPVSIGDAVSIQLVNTSERRIGTQGTWPIGLQYDDQGIWRSVTYYPSMVEPDAVYNLGPGNQWEWSWEIDRQSINNMEYHRNISMCAEFVSGTYRVVYWGLTRGTASEEHAIATEFEVRGE